MGFRRKKNRHDIWLEMCATSPDLLEAIPPAAMASEKNFRTLVTQGALTDAMSGQTITLAEFSQNSLANLKRFITHRTELDMDALTFDALNDLVASRVPGDLLTPPPPVHRRR